MIHYQIQIVTWNSEKSIRQLLTDIQRQTVPPHRVILVDNHSTDATVRIAEEFSFVSIIQMDQNTGFCHAHNRAFSKGTDCDFIACLNPDIRLLPDTLENLCSTMSRDSEIGSISPLLLRDRLTLLPEGNMIDAAGIQRSCTFHFKNYLEGKKFKAHTLPKKYDVMANTGACVLYRVKALDEIIHSSNGDNREVFDENFFAYQEDSDVGLRLLRKGWKNIVLTTTFAQHDRSIRSTTSFSDRSKKIIELSHRNHLLVLLKNATAVQLFTNGLQICSYEIAKALYLLIRFPKELTRSIGGVQKLFRTTLNKRSHTI